MNARPKFPFSSLYFMLAVCSLVLLAREAVAQDDFSIELDTFSIAGAPGVHSYAVGQYEDKWLIVGGRREGLHRRQMAFSFGAAYNNTDIIVVDPGARQVWTAPLTGLPAGIAEQLQSTNVQFEQVDTILYVVGGYAYAATPGEHITHDKITAINLPGAIDAVINGFALSPHFRQTAHPVFTVAGGQMDMLDTTFYLVGGHNFSGNYTSSGMPAFTQRYTNAIYTFNLHDDGSLVTVLNLDSMVDTAQLHRRDFNMMPQIFQDGSYGLTAFSGVFRYDQDLPWFNTVDIDTSGYTVVPGFGQYLSQYHSAKMAIADTAANEMHTIFFGGMSMYTLDTLTDLLEVDSLVPFVNTISRVTRYGDGTLEEFKEKAEMPGLLGSGAEFIGIDTMPYLDHEIVNVNALPYGRHLVGYICGGIESTLDNIFLTNNGTQSSAYAGLFEVYINKPQPPPIDTNVVDTTGLVEIPSTQRQISAYPNPARSEFTISIPGGMQGQAVVELIDESGRVVLECTISLGAEDHYLLELQRNTIAAGSYLLTVRHISWTASTHILLE